MSAKALRLSASLRAANDLLSQSWLGKSNLASSALLRSKLGKSTRPAPSLHQISGVLAQCALAFKNKDYQVADDLAAAVNQAEDTITLSTSQRFRGWLYRGMARIGLGEVSYDAVNRASECDPRADSMHSGMMELLGVTSLEEVKQWLRTQRASMSSDLHGEFAVMMSCMQLDELVLESVEITEDTEPVLIHYQTVACVHLGRYEQAEKLFQLLPPPENDGAAVAILGAHVYRGLHDYEKALLFVQAALVKTAPGSPQRIQLLFERAMLCLKLRHFEAVRQCIYELAFKPDHPDYLDAQLFLAKASDLPNARQIVRHLLSIFPGNVRVAVADLKIAYELAATKKELEDILQHCAALARSKMAEVHFVLGGTCVKLAWFAMHPKALTLPHQASLIPTSRGATASPSAIPSPRDTSSEVASAESSAVPSTLSAATATTSAAPSHKVLPSSAKATASLGHKELLTMAVTNFEECLAMDTDASKLASKYRKLLSLDLYSTNSTFSAQLVQMARQFLDRAVSLNPRNVKAMCLLAEQYRVSGQVEEAQQCLSQLESTPTALLGRALCLGMSSKAADKENAILALSHIKGIAYLSALFHKGRLYEEIGQYQNAEKAYVAVLNKDPKHMETLYRRGILQLTRLNNPKAALVTLDTILHQYKRDTVILEQKAHALIILGQYQDAIETLNEILRIDASHTRALTLKTTAESLRSNTGYFTAIASDSAQTITQAAKSLWGYFRWN